MEHKGQVFRIQIDPVDPNSVKSRVNIEVNAEDKSEIDEIVIDGWFHLEKLDDRQYHLQLGENRIGIYICEDLKNVELGGEIYEPNFLEQFPKWPDGLTKEKFDEEVNRWQAASEEDALNFEAAMEKEYEADSETGTPNNEV